MSEYLFLYPVKKFTESSAITFKEKNEEKALENLVSKLDTIIEKRYREKSYRVNWMMFEDEEGIIDYEMLDENFDYREEDRFIGTGKTFDQLKDRIYPDPEDILEKLGYPDELVLGGFHQEDCVDRIARHAYDKGVSTSVDEDTTDKYFIRENLYEVPIIREEKSLEELYPDMDHEMLKRNRRNRPWLVQE